MQARPLTKETGGVYFLLTFDRFPVGKFFVVKGTVITNYLAQDPSVRAILVVRPDATTDFFTRNGIAPNAGIIIRLAAAPASDARTVGFMIEISQFG